MILSGKPLRDEIFASLKQTIQNEGISPKLAVILVGNDSASETYVRTKTKAGSEVGIVVEVHRFDASIEEEKLIQEIDSLGKKKDVHGMIIQLPLPSHLHTDEILNHIPEEKDVDGFTLTNLGSLLLRSSDHLTSCTPLGIMKLLEYYHIDLEGKHLVIVGDGKTVGRPLAALALRSKATVTICNRYSHTAHYTKQADIIVVAVGKPHLITADMVKEGAVVIDVGINRIDGKLVGDSNFDEIIQKASCTPVPGGVGPMTVAMLLSNTLKAYRIQESRNIS